MSSPVKSQAELPQELAELRARLGEAEETLRAIRSGEVDALVMGEDVYTLKGAETPYRVLIEQMYEGAATLADDGTVLYANRRLAELLRIPLQVLIGTSLRRFVTPPELPVFDTRLAGGKQCSSKGEFTFRCQDGPALPVQLSFSVAYEQDTRPTCVIVTDLTERKRAEIALHQAHDSLEQRVTERTKQLQQATTELKRSNRDLEQFAYVASHDLQDPLRAISGYVLLLKRALGNELSAKAMGYITGAVDGAARMQQLIEDLLAFSRVGSREAALAPTDLNELLRQAKGSLQTAIKDTGAKLTSGRLPTLTVDAALITQLFQNLIANAIKFRRAGPPKIEVRARQEPDRWVISVRDNGIGIAPEHFERIFRIFQRLHTRKEYPGTGMGLAICQSIIERHGGRIWVESQPGQGATFFFSLPQLPHAVARPPVSNLGATVQHPPRRLRPQRPQAGPRGPR